MNRYNEAEELYLAVRLALGENNILEAKGICETILENEPGYALAHLELARIYSEHFKNVKQATKHYELALLFEPDRQEVYTELAWLYLENRELEKLEPLLTNAFGLAPSEEVNLLRIKAICLESMGKYREAYGLYKACRKLAGNIEFIGILKMDEERLKAKMGRIRAFMLLF